MQRADRRLAEDAGRITASAVRWMQRPPALARATTVDTATPITARVLDVTRLTGEDMDEAATGELRSLLRQLATAPMGQKLLRVAVDQRLTIRFATGDELDWGARGRAAGAYWYGQRRIVLDRRAQRDDVLATLAHELQHFVDDVHGWASGTIQCEVRANQSEALVIRQLALDAHCYGLTDAGALRHPEDIATIIRGRPMYRANTEEPLRIDGRVHPLLERHELLPPSLAAQVVTGGSGRVGAVGAVRTITPVQSTSSVTSGPVLQAAVSALGANQPTGWDPTLVSSDEQSPIGRFLGALDAHRLATGG
jgi:hypothetical protein